LKIGFVTLGCDKNTVDNEYVAGVLARRGHSVSLVNSGSERYDAVVITTCGFIEAASAQSMMEIDRWARRKREKGRPARLVVAGCLTQLRAEEILHAYPEVDGIGGVGNLEALAELIEEVDPNSGEVVMSLQDQPDMHLPHHLPRRHLQHHPYAYLKIADGCDHECAFCSIPLIKGGYASVAPDVLIEEARELIDNGVKELNIIGQDISAYGRDGGGADLLKLLHQLCALNGDFWIRLLYLYPGGMTDALLELIAREPRICNYLDLPLQHVNTNLLRKMKRPAGQLAGIKFISKIRSVLPEATLRTTFIVGLPGETDEAFEEMLEAVRTIQFDRLGAFIFSPQPGTAACTMSGQVDPELAQQRFDRLMREQQLIHFRKNQARVGQSVRVLFEGRDQKKSAAIARSQSEAPEIDGYIYVKGVSPKQIGEFGEVKITRADGYDLWAEL